MKKGSPLGAPIPIFTATMSRTEQIIGWLLLPVHIFLLPILLGMLRSYWPGGFSEAQLAVLYALITLLLILVFLRDSLRIDWDRLCDFKLPCLLVLVPTHILCIGVSLAVAVLMLLLPEELTLMYESALPELMAQNDRSMLVSAVLLAPIVEETLFRGMVFGSLRKKSRVLAYGLSILLNLLCVLWPYALTHPDLTILLLALQQLPLAAALAWCYERSGTVWSPVLYHALYALVPMLFM